MYSLIRLGLVRAVQTFLVPIQLQYYSLLIRRRLQGQASADPMFRSLQQWKCVEGACFQVRHPHDHRSTVPTRYDGVQYSDPA